MKPLNPYTRLREEFLKFARGVVYPVRRNSTYFKKQSVLDRVGYRLDDVYVAVQTATKLGFETHLFIDVEGDLRIAHVTARPTSLPL